MVSSRYHGHYSFPERANLTEKISSVGYDSDAVVRPMISGGFRARPTSVYELKSTYIVAEKVFEVR